MAMNDRDSDIRFRASLKDDLTPNLEKLEAKLKKMGASPSEIKMMLKAHDEATPKINALRKMMSRMPRMHRVSFEAEMGKVNDSLHKLKEKTRDPIRLTFVDNLTETMGRLTTLRSRVPLPMGGMMPGSNILYAGGAVAAGAGGMTAVMGVVQQGIKVNAEMEQSLITLEQTLKDQTKATEEMGKLVDIAQKTPFQYSDVMSADVRLRSYNVPTMPGEGGPGNQGWLKAAGDMAAAMNTPITQAVEAIADARQGYFVRMMTYGIRMMREDFQAGGKFAGMTFEQGLAQAIRRFEGAQDAQSKSFQGLMSNIKDIFEQQVVKPIGAGPFIAMRSGAESLQEKMQDPEFQRELAKRIETVQHTFVEMFDTIKRGKQYFEDNLKQPLMEFGQQVIRIGGTFVEAFGKVFVEVVSTAAKLLAGLVKPVVEFISKYPFIVQVYGVFKALSLLGFGGPLAGLTKMAGALNPLSPSIFRLVSGFRQLIGGAIIVGIAAITAKFINAKESANRLERAVADIGRSNGIKALNEDLATNSFLLDTSLDKMQKLAASAASNAETKDLSVISSQAQAAQWLEKTLGIDAFRANEQMNRARIDSHPDVDRAVNSLRQLDAAAKALGMSFNDATRIMSQFAPQAGPIGLGGTRGAPYLMAMSAAAHRPGFLTDEQSKEGIYGGDELMRRILERFHEPSVSDITKVGASRMGRYWGTDSAATGYLQNVAPREEDLGMEGVLGRGGPTPPTKGATQWKVLTDIQERHTANLRMNRQQQEEFQKVLQDAGWSGRRLSLPDYTNASARRTEVDTKAIEDARTPAATQRVLGEQWEKNEQELSNLNDEIDNYNRKINNLNKTVNASSLKQQEMNLEVSRLQHALVPLQHEIEEVQFQMQKLATEGMRPLERQSSRLGNEMTVLGNKLMNAQYQMEKYTSGLFTGEQAMLNQIHALERHQRQLQILQLSYNQIGAQLGTTTYQRGYSSRVAPLMGLSMQMQMERNERRMQMLRLQNDETFGEQRYQVEQAARPENQRRETSFEDQMAVVRKNVPMMDELRKSQHNLTNTQFALGQEMFRVSERMGDMQDKASKLQNRLQDKQLHGGFRELQEAMYHVNRESELANKSLTRYNILLEDSKVVMEDVREQGKVLQGYLASTLLFDDKQPGLARKAIKFAEAAGIITPEQRDAFIKEINKAERTIKETGTTDWRKEKGNWIDAIKSGVRGAFTGDLWNKLAEIELPVVGNLIGHGWMKDAVVVGLTVLTGGAALAAIGTVIAHAVRQTAVRTATRALMTGLHFVPGGQRLIPAASAYRRYALGEGFWRGLPGRFNIPARIRARSARTAVGWTPAARIPGAAMYAESFAEQNRVRDLRRGQVRFPGIGIFPGGREVSKSLGNTALKFEKFATKADKAGDHIVLGSRRHAEAIKDFDKNVKDHAKAQGISNRAARRQLDAANAARSNVDEYKKTSRQHATRMARIRGRWGSSVRAFGLAVAALSGVFGDFKKWMIDHLPGVNKTPAGVEPHGTSKAKGGPDTKLTPQQAADEVEERARKDSRFRESLEQAREKGAKGLVWGGQALKFGTKWAARGAGALSFLPAGESALEGDWGKAALQAANAGTYFIPYVGGARIAADLAMYTTRNSPRGGIDPNAESMMNRAFAPSPMQTFLSQNRGAAGTIVSSPEAMILTQNAQKQYEIASAMADTKNPLSPKAYEEARKKLRDLQSLYDKNMKIAIATTNDDADKMNERHHEKIRKREEEEAEKRVANVAKTQRDMLIEERDGFGRIYKVTDEYLRKLHKRVNATSRSLGLTSGGDDTANAGGEERSPSNRSEPLSSYAHGGFPAKNVIKGIGDSKGKLIRVGEEDDELIIPLAPHRRDRAKSLLNQASGMIGMANGGFTNVDRAYLTARREYSVARNAEGFAKGGFTKLASGNPVYGAGVDLPQPGLQLLAKWLNSRFGAVVISGLREGSTIAGTQRTSNHATGHALDLALATPAPDIRTQAGGLRGNYAKAMDRLHAFLGNAFRGQMRDFLWRTLTGGNHFNHIHMGFNDPWAKDPKAMAALLQDIDPGDIKSMMRGLKQLDVAGGVDLPKVPKELKKRGVVGQTFFKALRRLRKDAMGLSAAPGSLKNYKGGGNASTNMSLGKRMAAAIGWKGAEWQALQQLWQNESGWDHSIANQQGSGAYGIPQALPANKMASAGSDWKTNPATQIKWGLGYIKDRYGTPSSALSAWLSRSPHWYASGKQKIQTPTMAFLDPGERVSPPGEASTLNAKEQGHDKERDRKKGLETVEEIKREIKKVTKHLGNIDDRGEKKKDIDHLAELNKNLRSTFVRRAQVAQKQDKALVRNIFKSGDKSGGEDTAALVAEEKPKFKKEVREDLKADRELVKFTSSLVEASKALQKSARTPVQRRLATKARKASTKARTSARKVTAFTRTPKGKRAAREVGRTKYLVGAARRGISGKLAGAITGRKLTGRSRTAYKKAARTIRGKVDTKSERSALRDLRKALNSGLSKNARHLQGLRSDARRHAAKASRAVGRAAASQVKNIKGISRETRRTAARIQSGNKVSAGRMGAMIKELRKAGPRGRALASHLSKVREKVQESGAKGREEGRKHREETKKGRGDTQKADRNRAKAETRADKRADKDNKEIKGFLKIIADKDFSVNITNQANGASLKSTIVKSRFRSR